ncbi:MAG: hypothetical protein KIT70_00970 [Anaerolineales bacterium]|nr:MAG: hypothetical protein KIT70_00970 [Anaerolineales bacterium]
MAEVLRFFVQYEAVLYFLLGLAGILYFYRFLLAWQEVREAHYGLERQASRERLNQAALMLFGMLVIAVGVFVMVTFVATSLPAQDLLATPTLSLSMESQTGATTVTPAGDEVLATATALPTVAVNPEACIPAQIAITDPEPGASLSGSVSIIGTVDVTNFGFYKFEVARAEEELWLTIQAGRSIIRDDVLVENWDTSRLPTGDYVLQLVVTDSSGSELPPCRVPVRIEAPSS